MWKNIFQIYIQNRLKSCKTQFCGADFAESDLRNIDYKAKTLKIAKINIFFPRSDDRQVHHKHPRLKRGLSHPQLRADKTPQPAGQTEY